MKMKIEIVAILMIILLAGCTSQPVLNVSETRLPSLDNGSRPTVDVVQNAIMRACKERG